MFLWCPCRRASDEVMEQISNKGKKKKPRNPLTLNFLPVWNTLEGTHFQFI